MFEHWQNVPATVIDRIRIADESASRGYSATERFAYVLEVRPADGPAFRDEVKDSAWTGDSVVGRPAIGSTIPVLADLKHRKIKLPRPDRAAEASAASIRKAAREHFDASRRGHRGARAQSIRLRQRSGRNPEDNLCWNPMGRPCRFPRTSRTT